MHYDAETNMWYESKRDADKVKLWTRVQRGELRPIQGYCRYTITEEGEVLNINRALPVNPRSNGHRLFISLVDDEGVQRALSLGRLIATHFIPIPDDGQYHDVEFEDGNIQNIHPSNLYWTPRWKRHASPDNYDIDITL